MCACDLQALAQTKSRAQHLERQLAEERGRARKYKGLMVDWQEQVQQVQTPTSCNGQAAPGFEAAGASRWVQCRPEHLRHATAAFLHVSRLTI